MNVLCVLARVPSPGTGKSRLRRELGDATTDLLAAAFLDDVLAWSRCVADQLLVAHSGPSELMPGWVPREALVPQVEGGLGSRIQAAVDAGFRRGGGRVVIVGTDCPTLPASLLEAAFTGLAGAHSTLVPADDGGWIALGVDRPLRTVLDSVTWSSAQAGRETVAALSADGRPPAVLGPWYDIDQRADLERMRRDPALGARAPRTHAVLAAMVPSVP